MLKLEINEIFAKVTNTDTFRSWTIDMTRIFGLIINRVEKHFNIQINNTSEKELGDIVSNNIVNHFINQSRGEKTDEYMLFDCPEYGELLLDLFPFINCQNSFYPSLDMVEKIRISKLYELSPMPISRVGLYDIDFSKGIRYDNLHSSSHIAIAILHYYALNRYCLKKCAFCNKWFVPSSKGIQAQFCKDKYEYTDCYGKFHEYSNHYEARTRIYNRLSKRFQKIEKNLDGKFGQLSSIYNEFYNTASDIREKVKAEPTINNFLEYERYLYIDCQKYYKRYSRSDAKK